MNTNTKNQNQKQQDRLLNRPEQVNEQNRERIDEMKMRSANRGLRKEVVLNALKSQLPHQYAYAEIVGRWIWLEIPKNKAVASVLLRLGFHWNERREVFQHPCGAFTPYGSHPDDPRDHYHSYFVTALKDLIP